MSTRMFQRILERLGLRRAPGAPGVLSFDGVSEVVEELCACCGTPYGRVTSFVLLDGGAHAIAKTALLHHHGHEAFIDVVLGSFGDDLMVEAGDRVTFGCRVGAIEGVDGPAASAIDAAQPYGDEPMWGRKLTRDEALAHPRVREFWDVVDLLLLQEGAVARHMGYA